MRTLPFWRTSPIRSLSILLAIRNPVFLKEIFLGCHKHYKPHLCFVTKKSDYRSYHTCFGRNAFPKHYIRGSFASAHISTFIHKRGKPHFIVNNHSSRLQLVCQNRMWSTIISFSAFTFLPKSSSIFPFFITDARIESRAPVHTIQG